jgi:hypothetical protein
LGGGGSLLGDAGSVKTGWGATLSGMVVRAAPPYPPTTGIGEGVVYVLTALGVMTPESL